MLLAAPVNAPTGRSIERPPPPPPPPPTPAWAASTSPRLRWHATEIHGNVCARDRPRSFLSSPTTVKRGVEKKSFLFSLAPRFERYRSKETDIVPLFPGWKIRRIRMGAGRERFEDSGRLIRWPAGCRLKKKEGRRRKKNRTIRWGKRKDSEARRRWSFPPT